MPPRTQVKMPGTIAISISFTEELLAELDCVMQEDATYSRSAVVRLACLEYLERRRRQGVKESEQ